MAIYDWFLWFIIYSFIGWAWETALFTIQEKKFVNRGFLNGPLCPIYGFGGLLLLLLLNNRTNNIIILFLAAAVLTTGLEYLTAVAMEKLFHAKWWDYSMFKFNFQGRVCLYGFIIFGLMAVGQIRYFHPFLEKQTISLPRQAKAVISLVIFALILIDFAFTLRHVLVLNGRLSEIQAAINGFIAKYTKRYGGKKVALSEDFEESEFYSDRIKTLLRLDRFQNIRIIRAFPKLRSIKYDDALKKLKEKLISSRIKRQ
jgi:uncharacterized membrane protein